MTPLRKKSTHMEEKKEDTALFDDVEPDPAIPRDFAAIRASSDDDMDIFCSDTPLSGIFEYIFKFELTFRKLQSKTDKRKMH